MTGHQVGKTLHCIETRVDKDLGELIVTSLEPFSKDEFYLCKLYILSQDEYENCGGFTP